MPESWNDRRADPVSDAALEEKNHSKIKADVKHNRVIKDSGLASSRTAGHLAVIKGGKSESGIVAPQEDLYAHELHDHDEHAHLNHDEHEHLDHNEHEHLDHDEHEHPDHDEHEHPDHDEHEHEHLDHNEHEHLDHDTENAHISHEDHHQLSIRDEHESEENLGLKRPPNHVPSGNAKVEPHVIFQREIDRGHLHLLEKDKDKHFRIREDFLESHRRKSAADKEDLTPRRDGASKDMKRCVVA